MPALAGGRNTLAASGPASRGGEGGKGQRGPESSSIVTSATSPSCTAGSSGRTQLASTAQSTS